MILRAEPIWLIPMPETVLEIDASLRGYVRCQEAPTVPETTVVGAQRT